MRTSQYERSDTGSGLLLPVRARVRGRVTWSVLNEDGTPETPRAPSGKPLGPAAGVTQPNLITDLGLDHIASYSSIEHRLSQGNTWRRYLAVGTGSTDPDDSDTTLDNEVQRDNTSGGFGDGGSSTSHDGVNELLVCESVVTRTVTMNANRNLTEFGFSPTASADVGIRELLRDGDGDPVTVSLLEHKILRVDHTLTIELPAPAAGTGGSIDIDEYDAGDSLITSTPYTVLYGPTWFAPNPTTDEATRAAVFDAWNPAVSTGARLVTASRAYAVIGGASWVPVTAPATGKTAAGIAYSPGSLERTKRATFNVQDANGDAYGLLFSFNGTGDDGVNGGVHVEFTSPSTFEKLSTDTLTVGLISSWARS